MGSARSNQWDVFTDEHGNMYFYNAVTGESVWELPPEAADSDGDGDDYDLSINQSSGESISNTPSAPAKHKGDYSIFEIAVAVADAVLTMLDMLEDNDSQERIRSATGSTELQTSTLTANKRHTKTKTKKFASPAAEARAKRNAANDTKRRKRQRDKILALYIQLATTVCKQQQRDVDYSSGDAASEHASVDKQESNQHAPAHNIGALFTPEDTARWRLEREVERLRQRYAVRKQRKRHKQLVRARKQQHAMLQALGIDLTAHLLRQIEYSTELQQQRILLLASPQLVAEREVARLARMEPEMVERCAAEQRAVAASRAQSIEKIFVLLDDGAQGRVHLLQVLFGIVTNERAQQYALKVRGLAELLTSIDVQRFVLEFVASDATRDCRVDMAELAAFATIVEDAVDHAANVRLAVRDAEDMIDAADAMASTTGGSSVSRVRARVGLVSKAKVEHEIAELRATNELQAAARRNNAAADGDASDSDADALVPTDEWTRQHHHRFIRFDASLPLYCCLCRRRKWELERRDAEERESAFRSQWRERYTMRLREEELQLVASSEDGGVPAAAVATVVPVSEPSDGVASHSVEPDVAPTDAVPPSPDALASYAPVGLSEDDTVVLDVIRSIVTLTERILSAPSSAPASPKRRANLHGDAVAKSPTRDKSSKKTKKKTKTAAATVAVDTSDADAKLQQAMQRFECEESERKRMQCEDAAVALSLERSRRALERPLLQVQDAAHDAYIRLLSHVVDPPSLLVRLAFLRCLAARAPQSLTLHMLDRAERSTDNGAWATDYVLHTVPCRNDREAEYMASQLTMLHETLCSPFVARIACVSRHTYQLFADSGMLVECWPVLFVVTEFFRFGSWRELLHAQFVATASVSYAQLEHHLVATLRQVAAGLAAMHSLGVVHLNVMLDSIYVADLADSSRGSISDQSSTASGGATASSSVHVRLAGFLLCRASFTAEQMHMGSDLLPCLDFAIAPPEALSDTQPITTKADVWMLGCALYNALVMWQQRQLLGTTSLSSAVHGVGAAVVTPVAQHECERPVVHLKSIEDVMREIPIATSATTRSLLRMLLQRNPLQRPQMSQVVDYLSFAEKQSRTASSAQWTS